MNARVVHRVPRTVPPGPMLFMVGLLQVAKRVGLAKPMLQLALTRMLSPERARSTFEGFRPTEHDVLVATYGKSGTNWMMQIVPQISHRGEAEFDHIHEVVPWPDSPMPGGVTLDDPAPLAASRTGHRVIKAHLEAEYLPYDEAATYLTVLRDPKEVLVSSYYFLGGILGVLSHLSIHDWYDLCLDRDRLLGGWVRHTASFWDWRDRPNAFVVSYSAIQADPRGTIERVAKLMGVDLSEGETVRVLERSSFAYMKAHESQFAPPRMPFTKEGEAVQMVRRGRSGESEELLNRAQQAEIDRFCQAELRRSARTSRTGTSFRSLRGSGRALDARGKPCRTGGGLGARERIIPNQAA